MDDTPVRDSEALLLIYVYIYIEIGDFAEEMTFCKSLDTTIIITDIW